MPLPPQTYHESYHCNHYEKITLTNKEQTSRIMVSFNFEKKT